MEKSKTVEISENLIRRFLDAYLVHCSIEEVLSFFDDELLAIDSGPYALATNKQTLRETLREDFRKDHDQYDYKINYISAMEVRQNLVYAIGEFKMSKIIKDELEPVNCEFDCRISLSFEIKDDTERVRAFHLSIPSVVTENEYLRKELKEQMYRDIITGGNNKYFFEVEAERLLTTSDAQYAVVCTNIEKFKLINAYLGKKEADEVLRFIGYAIKKYLADNETYGRLHADNFGILYEYQNLDDIEARLGLINAEILKYEKNNDISHSIEMTYGIYLHDGVKADVTTMLDHAYLARKLLCHGDSVRYGIYDRNLEKRLMREKYIEDMRFEALEKGEFTVWLQPKHQVSTGMIVGAEALVRWNSPKLGMVYPDEFIHLYENNGFITKIDYYVFNTVCKLIKSWMNRGVPVIPISVNLSKVNLDIPGIMKTYKETLNKVGVDPKYLEFEFIENLAYDRVESLIEIINEIKEIGCKCSLDDFGSGYSSLNILKSITVDILKLDRMFFTSSGEEEKSRSHSVIKGVISMAKDLQFETICEGVETEEQFEFLKSAGCDMAQGYLFNRPMPIDKFEKLYLKGL